MVEQGRTCKRERGGNVTKVASMGFRAKTTRAAPKTRLRRDKHPSTSCPAPRLAIKESHHHDHARSAPHTCPPYVPPAHAHRAGCHDAGSSQRAPGAAEGRGAPCAHALARPSADSPPAGVLHSDAGKAVEDA